MQLGVREALAFHGLFVALAGTVLWLAPAGLYGWTLLWLTVGYNIALPVWALMRAHVDWLSLWLFLLPLSAAQLLPDWALVAIAQTLVFPDHGITRIGGAVPLYFAGMWTMLLFPIVLLAQASRRPYLSAGVLALLLFGAAEWAAAPLNLWRAQNVGTVAGIAGYALTAELLLVWATVRAYRHHRRDAAPGRVLAALSVSVFYTGALFLALLLVDPLFSRG